MMTIYYSASTRGFYHSEDDTGFPEDSVKVEQEYFEELFLAQEQGKVIVPDDDSNPIAVNPVTNPVEDATVEKANLIRAASDVIAPLKDALDGDYIEESDKEKLSAWQKYRYNLTRVDVNNPKWPKAPAL